MADAVNQRRFEVLSTDPKPNGIGASDVLDEIDTGRRYKWDKANAQWVYQANIAVPDTLALAIDNLGAALLPQLEAIRKGIELQLALHHGVHVDLLTENVTEVSSHG